MSEKRFLTFMFIEGLLLTVLGLCILILPKLTSLTFGVMLSASFITYGVYKAIMSIINRGYGHNVIFEVFLGIFLTVIGILLLLVPKINLLWLIALTGVYFLLKSISTSAFISQIRNAFNFGNCKMFCAAMLFLIGLIIILGLPTIAFWAVAILSGIAFVIQGMSKMAFNFANKNNYSR